MVTGFFYWIWNGITGLFGLMVPLVDRARNPGSWSPRTRWVLHFILVGLILAGLGFVNYYFDLEKYLEARWLLVRRAWLPLLFVLVYSLTWLSWWLWRQFGPDRDPVPFPDIDAAWEQAMAALHRAGIRPNELPLFLILGRPAGEEEFLFEAGEVPLQVLQSPRGAAAPLHVYAGAEGIYLTCSGASHLGRQAMILAGEFDEEIASSTSSDSRHSYGAETGVSVSVAANVAEAETGGEQATLARRKSMRTASADDFDVLREPATATEAEDSPKAPVKSVRTVRRRPSLLKDVDQLARQKHRLQHLCRLILRERKPACPINGVLLLLPYAALDTDADATQTGLLCQHDLTTLRDVLQVHCPQLGLVCDLEQAPGFKEFLERFPKSLRQRRVGQQFPYVPDLDSTGVSPLLESAVAWIFEQLLPPLVYRLFRVERDAQDDSEAILTGNIKLSRFLQHVSERQERLRQLLTLALTLPKRGPFTFIGCYLGGTGRGAQAQGFVAGVFRRLIESQDFVSWTPEGLEQDKELRLWSVYGYLGLGLFLIAVLLLGNFVMHH